MSKKVYQALALSFGLSWGLAAVAKLLGFKYDGQLPTMIVGMAYMLIPASAVFILSKFVWKIPLKTWGLHWPKTKIFWLAVCFPVVYALLTGLFSLLLPGVSFSPEMAGLLAKYQAVLPPEQLAQIKAQVLSVGLWMLPIIMLEAFVAGFTINGVAALGEELMWRGFLVKELKHFHWLKLSLIIGTIWGIWHAPLIIQGHNYPTHPYLGVFLMIIWCILLTPPMIYFTAKTKSVLTAAVFHGVLNGGYGLSIIWLAGGNDLTIGLTGLAGLVVLFILDAVLFILDRKKILNINQLLSEF